LSLHVESSSAEASDGGEDIVCVLGPSERFGISVSCVDVCMDCRLQSLGGAMGSTLDLLFCKEREEALDLIDPGRRRRSEMAVPTWPFANQSRISLVLWLDALSMMM
jgi:hypothetical protein